jgi:thiol:disulfide interchange protein DsbA
MIRRGFLAVVLLIVLAPLSLHAADKFEENISYFEIFPKYPGTEAGKIEVLEFFWYNCPHCYDFEPYLEKWLAQKPTDVAFTKLPVIFNQTGRMHAETYYALELMGKEHSVSNLIFSAVHDKKMQLNTIEAVEKFLAANGVDVDQFRSARQSFAVQTRVNRAADMAKRFDITGVPSVVVHGSYKSGSTRSFGEMIELVDYLIDKTKKEMALAKAQ